MFSFIRFFTVCSLHLRIWCDCSWETAVNMHQSISKSSSGFCHKPEMSFSASHWEENNNPLQQVFLHVVQSQRYVYRHHGSEPLGLWVLGELAPGIVLLCNTRPKRGLESPSATAGPRNPDQNNSRTESSRWVSLKHDIQLKRLEVQSLNSFTGKVWTIRVSKPQNNNIINCDWMRHTAHLGPQSSQFCIAGCAVA